MPPFLSRRGRTTRTLQIGGAVRPSERLFCLRAVAYLGVTQLGDDDSLALLVGAAKLDAEHSSQSLADQALAAMQDPTVLHAAQNDTIYSNLRYLQRFMELTDLEADLLAVAMAISAGRGVYAGTAFVLANSDGEAALTMLNLLAALTQADVEQVQAALAMDAVLWRSGLLRSDFGDGVEGCLELLPSAEKVLRRHGLSETEFLGHFLDVAPPPELEVADFEHMAGDVERLLRLLRYGIASGVRGLNVLLHGPPGTGKTQLARLLAKEVGVPLIGARSDGHEHADRQDRLRSLQLCQALLQRQSAALGLFDEIEDAFPPERMSTRSLLHGSTRKAWHHNLLESTSVPVLWIANDVDHLEPALLRRFTVIVALREPPRPARLRLLRRALGEQPVSEQWLQRAADDPGLTPADVTRAALVAKALVLPGDSAEVALEWALAGHRALRKHGERLEYRLDHRRYDLSYVNADMDLQAVVARLRARPRATMCLSGPPGSGKTAFCAHLAATLGVPLVQARASDLLDKYVGETEKRLAQLFASARDQGAVLLLDEADGLLRDRRQASQRWELTQVNELLCQIEAFDGIFACATNLPGELDLATLRRFHLKISFGPMLPQALPQAFAQTMQALGSDDPLSPDGLRRLQSLGEVHLGDLEAARRHCEILWDTVNEGQLLAAVEAEVRARDGRVQSAGFKV